MFHLEILAFLKQNYQNPIILNPTDFPESSFNYIFLPERKTVIHCIYLKGINQNGDYFLQFTYFFVKNNIKIIHLWEDVWLSKQAIVESRLLSIIGKTQTIPARLTQIERIDKPTLDQFLEENHLQGTTNAKLKYGLFLPERYFRIFENLKDKSSLEVNAPLSEAEGSRANEKTIIQKLPNTQIPKLLNAQTPKLLVAVASFSNAKTIIRAGNAFRSYELIRFANLKNHTIVGGFDKLLKNFIKEHSPDDIMTYADRDWSDGKSYQKLGFKFISQTPPQSIMLDNQSLMRYYSEKKLEPENQNLQQIWNTGSLKYILDLKIND